MFYTSLCAYHSEFIGIICIPIHDHQFLTSLQGTLKGLYLKSDKYQLLPKEFSFRVVFVGIFLQALASELVCTGHSCTHMHQRDASLPQLLLLQMHMLWRPSVCDPILFRSTCHTQLVLKSIASSYQYHQITWKIWQYLVYLWKWLDYKILNMTLVRLNLVGVKL